MFGASTSGGTGLFGSAQSKPTSTFGAAPATGNGGFLFGATTNNANSTAAPAASTGFSFGGNTAQNTQTSNSSLGAPATGQSGGPFAANSGSSTSGGLFGSTANSAPSGGLFGASANSGQQQQSQTAQGGLFGGNTLNTALGGLFGTKPAAPAPTNGAASGGLFGSTNTANAAPAASTGGLFGAKPAAGGLFGGNTASAPQPQSGGLFGGNTAAAGTSTGGLFGNKTATTGASTGGLFGGNNTNSATSTGGLFGGNNTTTSAATGGLFGNNNNNNTNTNTNTGTAANNGGLFGAAVPASSGLTNANNAQPSFNWSAQKPANSAAGTLNLSLASQAPTQMPQTASTYTPAVTDQVLRLKEQCDPSSAKCALKTHLYNKFTEAEMHVLLQQPRPANESPEDWENAMANRPGPLYYPVKVSSFSEVAQRVEVQLEHVAKSRILLRNINDKMDQLSSKHDLDNSTRIMRARAKHTNLSRRLLRLATVLAVLRLKGYPLLPEEEEISKQLQTLLAKISDPNGSVSKLSDIYARLAIIKGRSEDLSTQMDSSLSHMHGTLNVLARDDSEVVNDSNTQITQVADLLTKLLYKQQVGLNYLNDMILKDLDIVNKAASKR